MILVLNCGSQSIKWKVFSYSREKLKVIQEGHRDIFSANEFESVLEEEMSKIGQEINLIGHRIVHGGTYFDKPSEITEENFKKLEEISHLAPLHNPYNLLGVKVCKKIFPNIKQTAVFDTEFFTTLPEKACVYPLPENISKEYNFKRYGFQGISHQYAAKTASELVKKPSNKLRIITCHLGGGCSISAIKNGKAIDTTMGFTPLEGVIMMTRSGSIDPAITLQLVKEYGIGGADKMLNKDSGVKGICGEENMLKVLEKLKQKDKKAQLAFDMFVYSIQKQIGAYFAILGKCDLLVFTGSIGSGNPKTRNTICKGLDILKKTKIIAIKTDEELTIAQKILKI